MGILMGEPVLKEYIKVPEESSISEEGSDSSNIDTATEE